MEYLQVSEIFQSVQGEGPNLGVPSTFVRVARCNLHCSFCLPPHTYIRTTKGSRSINKIEAGMELIGFDPESGGFVITKVVKTTSRLVSNLHALKIKGRENPIRSTAGHQWLTSDGWKRADEIRKGDEIVRAEGSEKSLVEDIIFVARNVGRKYTVYDLTCEPYPTFLAYGLVSHNCDTPYTWRFNERIPHGKPTVYNPAEEIQKLSIKEVADQVRTGPSHVVLTGGEPMLQADKLTELMYALGRFYSFEFETAGTIAPNPEWEIYENISYVVSPKLSNSGNQRHLRYKPDVLEAFRNTRAVFKFVVCDEKDFGEIDDIVTKHRINPHRVFIMPEGMNAETVLKNGFWLTPLALRRGYRTTTRLQVLLWGNKRGV